MIVVTGGSGFMGRHLVRRLRAEGRPVTVLDLAPLPQDLAADAGVRLVAGSITDPGCVAAAMAGAEAVVHLAALVRDFGPAREFARLNVDGTRTVASVARDAGVRRLVHMSSVAVFDYRLGFRDADEERPAGEHEFAYGRTKREGELVVRTLARPDFETVIVRPGLFPYGPGDRTASAPMLRAVERGVPLLIDGGRAVLSTSYVGNLVDGVVRCLVHPAAAGETFHLADDGCPTWRDLVAAMAAALGVRPPRGGVPRRLAAPAAGALEAAWRGLRLRGAPPLTRYRVRTVTSDLHFSSRKATRLLGWVPSVGLADGLAATVAWYRAGAP